MAAKSQASGSHQAARRTRTRAQRPAASRRELGKATASPANRSSPGGQVTRPDRVVFAEDGIKRGDPWRDGADRKQTLSAAVQRELARRTG
jgi:hypothetical protein